jgi:hypothetical protein
MKKDGMKGEAEEVITDGLSLQIEHRLRGICGMNTSKGEERMKMKIKKKRQPLINATTGHFI